MTCEEAATYETPERVWVNSIIAEAAPKLQTSAKNLQELGLVPWILSGRQAPRRIVVYNLNPRRGDVIIDHLPDVASLKQIYPQAQFVLLTPNRNLIQDGAPNFKSVQIKNIGQSARAFYDSYKNLDMMESGARINWNFGPFLADLEEYFDESTMIVAIPNLLTLLHATREKVLEEMRRQGIDMTSAPIWTSYLESNIHRRFKRVLDSTLQKHPGPSLVLGNWPKTFNVNTKEEQLWRNIRHEFAGRRAPPFLRGMAYGPSDLRREVLYGMHNVHYAPRDFFAGGNLSADEETLLSELPKGFVLINMNKGEQRKLHRVETESAVFLDKLISRLSQHFPEKKFVVLDVHESWKTGWERYMNPAGQWVKDVEANRAKIKMLQRKYAGKVQIIAPPDSSLPHIIERAGFVITHDSGFSHTAVAVLGPQKVLMISEDEAGHRWAAPYQPRVINLGSWRYVREFKINQILERFTTFQLEELESPPQ